MFTRMIYPLSLRERISWRARKFFPKAIDKNVRLQFDKNLKMDLSNADVGHQSIIFNGFYELGLTKNIVAHAKKGGVFFDVGANFGYYTCLWASKKRGNKVFAFEASPLNLAPLQNNIAKNKLDDSVTIVPNAAGKEKGKLKFDLGNRSKQTGWGGLSIADDSTLVEVDVITLDRFCQTNGITKIDVLKIDTEGADTWVLFGAEKLLREKKIDHIYFEHNPARMKILDIKEDEAQTFLENIGYKVVRQGPNDFYACPKKSDFHLNKLHSNQF